MSAPRRILVALSGGVDSATAAGLLREQGHELVGVFMRNGVSGGAAQRSCCSLGDARDARGVAERLGIPFYVADLERPFAKLIAEFAADYARGLTPNPCVVCNHDLKFGELLRLADDLGCESVATGHYARLEDGRLRRGLDASKDQSYLLHGLTPAQLQRARLPLGGLTKPAVRATAARLGLAVAAKPDSAEICFVPGGDYRAVVAERTGGLGAAGRFADDAGETLGEHSGVAGFTVGQRRGLGIAAGEPLYVSAIDPGTGTVTVGPRASLLRESCRVGGVSWQQPPVLGRALAVQSRQHHPAEPACLLPDGEDGVRVHFERPSAAVTPGQYAVFYDGDLVLGGGRIRRESAGD